jgi:hypothetical protein
VAFWSRTSTSSDHVPATVGVQVVLLLVVL